MRLRLLSLHVIFTGLSWFFAVPALACYVWNGAAESDPVANLSSCAAEMSAEFAAFSAAHPSYCNSPNTCTLSGVSASVSDVPTAGGQACNGEFNVNGSATANIGTGSISTTSGCPTCGTAAGNYDVVTPTSSPATPGSTACGTDFCTYTYGPTSSFRSWVLASGGKQVTSQTATTAGGSGATCAAPTSPLPTPGSKVDTGAAVTDCQVLGSAIGCVTQSTSGTYCGTYNGDQVCVGAIAPGKCEAFASGGVACTEATNTNAASSPPAPNNGTSGVPATPTAVLTDNVSGTPSVTNYYGSSTVSGSTVSAPSSGAGTNVGATNTAGVASGGSGSGAGTVGADCDTASNPGGCTGAVPGAQTAECASYAGCLETFWGNVQSAPIFTAVTALGTAWPSGSCPAETVMLTTFAGAPGGGTFDYGTTMCNVWANYAVPILSATTLVFFSLVAVFIVMSA